MIDGDLILFAMNVDAFLVCTVWLFVFCYYGDEVTGKFKGLSVSMYKLNWHLYPIEIRRNMPLIMSIAQKPIYLRGFGRTECTREVFNRLINASYTFFMALRRLTH